RDAARRSRRSWTGQNDRQTLPANPGPAYERLREGAQRPARDADPAQALSDFRSGRSRALDARGGPQPVIAARDKSWASAPGAGNDSLYPAPARAPTT